MRAVRWSAISALVLLALATSGARTSCVPIEPDEPACAGENPEGCVSTGCDVDERCLPAAGVCVPSACDCDGATGQWVCTPDCSGGICVPAP